MHLLSVIEVALNYVKIVVTYLAKRIHKENLSN